MRRGGGERVLVGTGDGRRRGCLNSISLNSSLVMMVGAEELVRIFEECSSPRERWPMWTISSRKITYSGSCRLAWLITVWVMVYGVVD